MKNLLVLLILVSLNAFSAPRMKTQNRYPYNVNLQTPHKMQIINSGVASLQMRLDMIERAKESIELEYFILNPDESVKLIMLALIKKAQEGVKVRILVDKSMPIFTFNEYYAEQLSKYGLELRFYNDAKLWRVSSIQFRNHRKLLVIDSKEAMTGGRNLSNEYFDLSTEFNFLDRDVWLEGPIVNAMKESFNRYWSSKITEVPAAPKPTLVEDKNSRTKKVNERRKWSHIEKRAQAALYFHETKKDLELLEKVKNISAPIIKDIKTHTCNDVTYTTDKEGGTFTKRIRKDYKEEHRILRNELMYRFKNIEQSIAIDSPYFLVTQRTTKALRDVLDSNKEVTILTNSLASTDAIYVATNFNRMVKEWTPYKNFNAHIYTGKYNDETAVLTDEIRNAIWGTHSKSMVFDNDSIKIGTFNIDNRSSFYNSEMAIFCDGNAELAQELKDNIKLRIDHSLTLDENGKPTNGKGILQNTSTSKKALYFMLKVPSYLLQFLL